MKLAVDKADAFLKFGVVVNNAGLADAGAAFFGEAFDDEGEGEAFGAVDFGGGFGQGKNVKAGGGDAVVAHDHFGDGFVVGEHEAAGVAAGVGQADHFEVADDVGVEDADAAEFFEEVKGDVGLEGFDGVFDDGEVGADAAGLNVVAEVFEGGVDVEFGFKRGDLRIGQARDGFGGDEVLVAEEEDFHGVGGDSSWGWQLVI